MEGGKLCFGLFARCAGGVRITVLGDYFLERETMNDLVMLEAIGRERSDLLPQFGKALRALLLKFSIAAVVPALE